MSYRDLIIRQGTGMVATTMAVMSNTYCGLMPPHDVIDLSQHWNYCVTWRHYAIRSYSPSRYTLRRNTPDTCQLWSWYHQTSNISHTLVANKIVYHSDVVGASIACLCYSNYIIILDLTPGFNGLGKDNCKTRRETFRFGDLVRLILDIDGSCWYLGTK